MPCWAGSTTWGETGVSVPAVSWCSGACMCWPQAAATRTSWHQQHVTIRTFSLHTATCTLLFAPLHSATLSPTYYRNPSPTITTPHPTHQVHRLRRHELRAVPVQPQPPVHTQREAEVPHRRPPQGQVRRPAARGAGGRAGVVPHRGPAARRAARGGLGGKGSTLSAVASRGVQSLQGSSR